MEIILSAGMPRVSISELAENNCSNCPSKDSIKGTAIVYSKGRIGISASLFLEFIKPPYGIAKNKREICKDKQILMISRFYKPAFVTIIFLRTYYKRKRRGNARKKSSIICNVKTRSF